VLIGGLGADKLTGNSDEDVLIAGNTSHDANQAALLAIMAEWSSNKTYAVRVSNLLNGTGLTAGNKLNGNDGATQTVFDDADIDTLSGNQGTDVFWANLVADNGGAIDLICDKAGNETANDSDL
jgi:hypothetical protein